MELRLEFGPAPATVLVPRGVLRAVAEVAATAVVDVYADAVHGPHRAVRTDRRRDEGDGPPREPGGLGAAGAGHAPNAHLPVREHPGVPADVGIELQRDVPVEPLERAQIGRASCRETV